MATPKLGKAEILEALVGAWNSVVDPHVEEMGRPQARLSYSYEREIGFRTFRTASDFGESSNPTVPAVPPELFDRIMSMQRPARWYGPRSRAITKSACEAAIEFVGDVVAMNPDLPPPWIGPSPLGGVSLEWDLPAASFMARVSSGDARRVYFQVEGPGQYRKVGTATRFEAIAELLAAHRGG